MLKCSFLVVPTRTMKSLRLIDVGAFTVSIIAGSVAAIAGGAGWTSTAVVSGCIAALSPIVNRVVTSRQHADLLSQLGPRKLSPRQRAILVERLRAGSSFKVWVAHNRLEAEPSQFHKQIADTLTAAGLDVEWFGGMNNSSVGIEIAGTPSPEKTRLLEAFSLAKIPFRVIEFSDPGGQYFGLSIWIGSKPSPSLD